MVECVYISPNHRIKKPKLHTWLSLTGRAIPWPRPVTEKFNTNNGCRKLMIQWLMLARSPVENPAL